MYKVILEKPIKKFLEKHKWEVIIEQFEKSLIFLSNDPYENDLDIRLITGLPNTYWLRIWKYRFLYEIIDDTISIVFIKAWSRWKVYKSL